MEAAVLALLGAASWGTGDFFGGLASRRAHVLTVLVVSQAVGLVGVAAWAIVSGDSPPGIADILPAVGAGVAGAAGLAALYRGMAIGAMGIVAPISAVSPVVPLGVDLVRGDAPAALLHDVGRVRELGRGPAFRPTREGALLGHVQLGVRLVDEHAGALDTEVRAELLHAIAAHHERPAARTAEAAVLYHANQLDAQAATRPVGAD